MSEIKKISGSMSLSIEDEENSIDDISEVSVDTRTTSFIKALGDDLDIITRIEGSHTTDTAGGTDTLLTGTVLDRPDIIIFTCDNPIGLHITDSGNEGITKYLSVNGMFYLDCATFAAGFYISNVTITTRTLLQPLSGVLVDGTIVNYLYLALKKS
jgi:hypothetical protein